MFNNHSLRKPATNVMLYSFKNCTQELLAVVLQALSDFYTKLHIQQKINGLKSFIIQQQIIKMNKHNTSLPNWAAFIGI